MINFWIYTTESDNLSKAKKEMINVLNRLESLTFDLYLDGDDLPTMPLPEDDKVKSEPEEIIAKWGKLEPSERKKKNKIKNINSK